MRSKKKKQGAVPFGGITKRCLTQSLIRPSRHIFGCSAQSCLQLRYGSFLLDPIAFCVFPRPVEYGRIRLPLVGTPRPDCLSAVGYCQSFWRTVGGSNDNQLSRSNFVGMGCGCDVLECCSRASHLPAFKYSCLCVKG